MPLVAIGGPGSAAADHADADLLRLADEYWRYLNWYNTDASPQDDASNNALHAKYIALHKRVRAVPAHTAEGLATKLHIYLQGKEGERYLVPGDIDDELMLSMLADADRFTNGSPDPERKGGA
jgi:hypothetical protein